MNFLTEITSNVSLVIVLAFIYIQVYPLLQWRKKRFQVLAGLLVGGIGIIAMMIPVTLAPGVVFDGRSIILAVCGYFMGPLAVSVAALVDSLYRAWLGGSGTLPGILVIVTSSAIGVAMYRVKQHTGVTHLVPIISMAFLTHIVLISYMLLLPEDVRWEIVSTIALPILTVYPAATILISWYLLIEEKRIDNTQKIRENASRLQRILTNMPVMLDAFDDKYNIIAWNRQCEKVTGYSEQEAMEPGFFQKIYPDSAYREYVFSTIEKQQGDFYDVEFTLKSKDGQDRIISWSNLSDEFPIEGWGTWAIGVDVTRRKKIEDQLKVALEEKQVLLREVHHRVKNNMQTIAGILDLQLNSSRDSATIDHLHAASLRVMAMGLLHKTLYQSERFNTIELSGYIEALMESIVDAYLPDGRSIELNLNIADCNINLDTSLPLGLMIGEIVTNSLKHGLALAEKGVLTITGSHVPGNLYRLAVRDNGSGLPANFDPGSTSTLGFQLIQNLASQIDSELVIENDNGTIVTIIFSPQ